MLGCVTPCWVKQERDPYHVLVPIDYQAVSGNGGVLPTGCPEPAVPCPILPGGVGGGAGAVSVKGASTHWEPR